IAKLKQRRALLQKQVKGPLEELRQIEEDLEALGATSKSNGRPRAPRGAQQAAILRAIRNGATTPEEIAAKTRLPGASVRRSISRYADEAKLVTHGINGLTLTKRGRD